VLLDDRPVCFIGQSIEVEVVPTGSSLADDLEKLPVQEVFSIDDLIKVAVPRTTGFRGQFPYLSGAVFTRGR
jgi:hypothetical protein